jgi:hypothetical protein
MPILRFLSETAREIASFVKRHTTTIYRALRPAKP